MSQTPPETRHCESVSAASPVPSGPKKHLGEGWRSRGHTCLGPLLQKQLFSQLVVVNNTDVRVTGDGCYISRTLLVNCCALGIVGLEVAETSAHFCAKTQLELERADFC